MNRVCRRDPLGKSGKPEHPTSFSARVTNDDGVSPDDDSGGMTGASLTAVLLAFLNVASLLARGRAEGNRGRGLMVTLVDRPEDGGAVDGGSDGIVDVATDLQELAGGEDESLSGRRGTADGRECAASRLVRPFGG